MAETREAPAGAAPLAAAMAALADGPRRRDLVPALPPGTRVLATSLGEGTATVDLSGAFAAGYAAGAAGELAQIAPLVVTATAVPGAERVLVLVDGAAPDVPGAQFDLSAPLRRADLPAGMRG
ncbi:MAG: GerMN domain-containing protein [Thermoleophilia bacterium]|nr:GerMN domain-containing protein [Thermoleophilia bacterium]